MKHLPAAVLLVIASPSSAADLPSGGNIVAGAGNISQSGTTMNVVQNTANMVADWSSFSVGQGHTVNFIQPSSQAAVLNRVLGSDVSVIQGALNANGKVFLLNPNGVLFAAGSRVNVGSMIASTLNMSTADFLSGNYRFEGSSSNAIVNQGNITALGNGAGGGTVALIAAKIINQGTLTASAGNVLLGAGSHVVLDLGGPVKIEVERGAVDALIEQGGAIKADGGLVYLTARAAGELASTVINHSGTTEAQTLVTGEKGQIFLMGGMEKDRILVGGTLDASAPASGDGGFIETSAAEVAFADGRKITTRASQGRTGQWLIDPVDYNDYTIAASGGNITGSQLSLDLAENNVTIQTTSHGTAGGRGDILVNDSINWSANTLTLKAERNIEINARMGATGTAGLALEYGQSMAAADAVDKAGYMVRAPIDLAGTASFSTRLGSDGGIVNYTVITSLGSENSSSRTDLQGMNSNLAGNYVLGADIDASGTASWDGGFAPIAGRSQFSGRFDGLGHVVRGLNIDRVNTEYVGLFANIGNAGVVQNVGLVDSTVSGGLRTGGVAGSNQGLIHNSYVAGTLSSSAYRAGGLAGQNLEGGVISGSHATANVFANQAAGGLVGVNFGTIFNSYATGNVAPNPTINPTDADRKIGGLVGANVDNGSIANSYATGSVTGGGFVGGLAGWNGNIIDNSYATGAVEAATEAGGLVGRNDLDGSVENSYALGSVKSDSIAGGLVGFNRGLVYLTYATGHVSGPDAGSTGGLVGSVAKGAMVSSSYWDVDTTGQSAGQGSKSKGSFDATAVRSRTGTTAFAQATYCCLDFDETWFMVEAATRPFLRSEYSNQITNAHQLQLMAMDLNASYRLGNDIDLGPSLADPSGMWKGTGLGDPDGFQGSFSPIVGAVDGFSGSFDGQSHVIRNLTVNHGVASGLFGVASGATLKNIGLENARINGDLAVGSLAGFAENTSIDNVYATGTVAGSYAAGGLVGWLMSGSSITNAYSSVAVSGWDIPGGLVGLLESSSITDSYSTGPVHGYEGAQAGGLVGMNNGGTVQNSYWNLDTSLQATSAGGAGLTDSQMKTGNSFAAWDISSVGGQNTAWRMYEGNSAPLLRSFLTKVTLHGTQSIGSRPYDGTTTLDSTLQEASWSRDGNWFTPEDSLKLGTGALSLNSKDAGLRDVLVDYYSTQIGYDIVVDLGESSKVTITPKALIVDGSTAADKTYDGTTNATINVGTLSGFVGSETVTATATGTFDGKDAGERNATAAYTLVDGTGGGLAGNYILSNTVHTALISPKVLTVAGSSANDKAYDGNTSATINVGTLSGFVGSETVTATATGTFESKDAGERNATAAYVLADGAAGGLAGNYVLSNTTHVATITPRAVRLAADDKEKIHLTADPALTWRLIDGSLVGSDQLDIALSRVPGEAVGRYAITAQSLGNHNYQVAADPGTLMILPSTAQDNSVPHQVAAVNAAVNTSLNTVTASLAITGSAIPAMGVMPVVSNNSPELQSSGAITSEGIVFVPAEAAEGSGQLNGFKSVYVVSGGINVPDAQSAGQQGGGSL